MGFRILDLPSLAQREIFLHFRAIDLFELSFTSTRARHCILFARLRAVEHTVKFEDKHPQIVTVFKRDDGVDEDIFTWKFIGKEKCNALDRVEKKVGCHRFDECYTKRTTVFCRFHNSEFGASVIFDYIFSILPGPVNLNLKLNSIRNIHAVLLNENFSKCQNLEIWEIQEKENNEDMAEILDLVRVEKKLKSLVAQKDEVDIEKIQNLDSVLIMDAEWMYLSTLLSFKCRFGGVLNHKFGPMEITAFVENWYSSTDRTMARMRFGWDNCHPFELSKNKLEWKKWDPKRRSRYFYDPTEPHHSNRIDCSEGHDLTRPDGLTATILFEDLSECSVMFFVWHDLNPEKARLKTLNEQMTRIEDKINALKIAVAPRLGMKYHVQLDEETDGLYNRISEKKLHLMVETKIWREAEECLD